MPICFMWDQCYITSLMVPHMPIVKRIFLNHFLPILPFFLPFSPIQYIWDCQNNFFWVQWVNTLLLVPNIPSVEQFSKKFVFLPNFAIFADSAHTVRLRDPELILLSSVDQYAPFGTLQVKSTVKLGIFIFLVFLKRAWPKMSVRVKIKIGTYENILV